jgi:hypothetical protein
VVLVLGLIAVRWSGVSGAGPWFVALELAITIAFALYARHSDVTGGTAFLSYALEGDAAQSFEKMQAPFRELATCQLVWHINATGKADAKYNAGATTNLRRTEVRPTFSRPPRVQCNIEVPTLKAGRTTLYFFPDRLLVYDAGGVGAVGYPELKIDVRGSGFVENGRLPKDSQQVGTTWQYVNKKGGPDRRFNNNRQIPVMQYGVIGFSSNSGLQALFMCSRPDAANRFHDLMHRSSAAGN